MSGNSLSVQFTAVNLYFYSFSFFSSTLTITMLRDLQIPFPVVVLAGVPGDAVHLPDRLVGSHGVGG